MKTIIDKSECKPLSEHIEGKLVIIGAEHFKAEYRDAKYQLVLATGGFGCDVGKMGNAVYIEELYTDGPEHYRRERYELIGEPTEEIITEWKLRYGEFNDRVKRIMEEYADE